MSLTEMTLVDLLPLVERATGPDRELDRALWYKLVFDPELAKPGLAWIKTPGIGHAAPAYTASIDQALALCERVLPGWQWMVRSGSWAKVWAPAGQTFGAKHLNDFDATASTPALALLAAMLRALIAQEDVKPFVCEGNGSACTDSGSTAVEPKSDGPCKSEGAR